MINRFVNRDRSKWHEDENVHVVEDEDEGDRLSKR